MFSILWYSLPLRWARYVSVISEQTGRQLKCNFPGAADKTEVIPNCVDRAFSLQYRITRKDAAEPCVLQVGTAMNKNLERMAAALSGLPVRLRIIGMLSEEQRSLLQSLDLGWSSAEGLSGEEIVREYHDSDVLMFVSTYEGLVFR